MGKKGSWFSKIKRVFTPHSKEKLGNEAERKSGKEKRKKGFGKLRCGETSSFLPIFREPSSIEKIFGEAERDHNLVFRPPPDRSNPSSPSPPPPPLRPTSPRVASPRAPASPKPPPPTTRADVPRLASPRSLSPKPSSSSTSAPPPLPASTRVSSPRPVPQRVVSPQAISIKPPSLRPTSPRADSPQALSVKPPSSREDPPRQDSPRPPSSTTEPPRLNASRPTTPRPPSPKTVSPVQQRENVSVQHASATKIQATFRGYKARRSFRALKGLARLQRVVKGYNVKRQTVNAMKYMQQVVRVQSQIQSRRIKTLENQAHVEKNEAKRSASEAGNDKWDYSVLTKEERDARSQRKTDAIIKRERYIAYAYSHKLRRNSPKSSQDARSSGGLPLRWNWGERASPVPSHSQTLRDYMLTPTRLSPSPLSQSSNQNHFRHDNNFDTSTPTSTRSTFLTPSRPFRTSRYSVGRLRGQDSPFKDDDSFTSCPPYPRYMAPTVSAKAKARPNSNPKEKVMGTPSVSGSENRRMSYPLTQQGMDVFRWNKGSLHMSNSGSHRGHDSPGGVVLEKHKTVKSVGNLSIDTTISMPATIGRKPFNIYV